MGDMAGISRNAPCPCGSGKKHKHCCEGAPPPQVRRKRAILPVSIVVAGLAAAVFVGMRHDLTTGFAVAIAGGIFAILASVFRDPPPPTDRDSHGAINFGK
jgi:hypothetical protein